MFPTAASLMLQPILPLVGFLDTCPSEGRRHNPEVDNQSWQLVQGSAQAYGA